MQGFALRRMEQKQQNVKTESQLHKVLFLYIMNIIMIHFIHECQSTLMRTLLRIVISQNFFNVIRKVISKFVEV